MATMQITKVGYEQITDALQSGYTLKITKVKFGTGSDYVPTAGDVELHGHILYEGPISNVDVVNDDIIDFLCICPENLGVDTVTIGEVGLYIENTDGTDTLFALACYPYPFSKAPNMRYKTHCLVLNPYISNAVDLTLTWTMSLPRVNYYGDLPNPERTGDNAYIVNHGFTDSGVLKPSLVTRYAMSDTGPLAWGLLNGDLYYDGYVTPVEGDPASFKLAGLPLSNFPAINIKFAFVYVCEGTGRTQCRALSYNASLDCFTTLYEDFSLTVKGSGTPSYEGACNTGNTAGTVLHITNLDSSSRVLIWTAVRMEATGLVFRGRWDAAAGYPSSPIPGSYWVVSGNGIINGTCYQVGDWMVFSGDEQWDKIDNTELPYLLYRGDWDASTGQAPPPQPIQYYWQNIRQGHYWVISTAGVIAGVWFDVDDWIVWNGTKWQKVDNKGGLKFRGYHAIVSDNHVPTVLTDGDYWIVSQKGTINGIRYDVKDILVWTGSTFMRLINQEGLVYQGLYDPSITGEYPVPFKSGDLWIVKKNGEVTNQDDPTVKDNLYVDDFLVAIPTTSTTFTCDTNSNSTILNTTGNMRWKVISAGGLTYRGTHDASTGIMPIPLHKGDYWVITNPGYLNGVYYETNDWITFNGSSFNKVSNREGLKYQGLWEIGTNGSVPPTHPVEGDFWIVSSPGSVQGTGYSIGDWLVWTNSGWTNVDNRPGFYYRGDWNPTSGTNPVALKEGDLYRINAAGTFNGEHVAPGDFIVWTTAGWLLILGTLDRIDIPRYNITTNDYMLREYEYADASTGKVYNSAKNLKIGFALEILFKDRTNPVYVPYLEQLNELEFCGCTCTCTCQCTAPCNCCKGAGPV
jgi:hypothetical protein